MYKFILFFLLISCCAFANAQNRNVANVYSTKWVYNTNAAIRSTPTIYKDQIFVGNASGELLSLDKKTGKRLWKFKTGGAVHSKPLIKNNIAFFTSRDNHLYAVDINTHALVWKFFTGNLVPHKWGWEYLLSSPVSHLNNIYVGGGDGILYCLDAVSGKQKWKYQTNGRIRCSPGIQNELIYFGSFDGFFYALNAVSGQLQWKFETQGPGLNSDASGWDRQSIDSSPAFGDGMVVFGSRDGNVYALDAASGNKNWNFSYGPTWAIATPVIADNTVYIGWSDNFLFSAIDLATGKEKWKYKAGYYIYSSPALAGNTVLFGSHDGNLYGFNRITGEKLWQYRTNGAVLSSPILDNKIVYVGSDDGNLYAFEPSNIEPVIKAVFAPKDSKYQPWTVDPKLASFLSINGFEALDSVTIIQFIKNRISDGKPSTLIFASRRVPESLITTEDLLVKQFMNRGGKIVWLGPAPNLEKFDASGKFIGEDVSFAENLLGIEFDMHHDAGWYYTMPTEEGNKWGLKEWYIGSFSIKPQKGVQALAINEYGRPSAWAKRIGNKKGGFIQIRTWPQDKLMRDKDLEIIKNIATFEFK